MLPDGYTPLLPRRLATLTTYLRAEIPARATMPPMPMPFRLERLKGADVARYLALFRAVGSPWLWFGHLVKTEGEIAALLDDADYECYALAGGRDAGLLSLDFRNAEEVWLDYFGLVPGVIGEGLGRSLIKAGFARVAKRGKPALHVHTLHVHTCTFDHPKALAFYMKNGFVPYARAVECFEDPRLNGLLPRDCAPWLPMIE